MRVRRRRKSDLSATDVAGAGWLLDPAGFGSFLSGAAYKIPPHVDFMSRIVADRVARGGARVLFSLPPQHGKSLLMSGWFPAWRLENDPSRKVGVVSYNQTLASRSVRFARDTMVEHQDKLRVRLGKSSEEYFETVMPAGVPPGYCRAMGITGGITGFGYDDLVIDDPYAGPEEANSASYRAKVEETFWGVLMTRLSEQANVFGIMTRWNEFDIFGKLIKDGGWEEVRIPAIAEENDQLGRAPGTALWPAKHSLEKLIRFRDGVNGKGAMPARIFQALYQGRPLADGGSLFKPEWFHVVEARPELVRGRVRYWDPAASKKQKGSDPDFAVATLMSVIRDGPRAGCYCVEHIDRDRGTALDLERRIVALAQRDGPSVAIRIEEEPASEAAGYITYLKRLLVGFDVQGVKHSAGADKLSRAKPFAGQMEVGNVVWVRGPWLEQAIQEICRFDGSGNEDHDDVPDSVTGAFEHLCVGKRWPWQMLGKGDPERVMAQRINVGFDRDDYLRALDALAPESAVRALTGGGL